MRTTPRRSELSATTLARSISCVRKWATRGKSIALELAREFRRLASSYITVMGGNTISGLLLRLVLLITFSVLDSRDRVKVVMPSRQHLLSAQLE